MGVVKREALLTTVLTYVGVALGYLNKGILFLAFLTTDEIGIVSLVITTGLLLAQFASFGTPYTTWKFLPYFKNYAKRHNGFLPAMLLLSTFGILLFTAIYLLFKNQIIGYYSEKVPEFETYFYWILCIGIGYVYYMVLESYTKGFFKNLVALFSFEIFHRLFMTVSLLLLFYKVIDFHAFVILQCLSFFLPTGIMVMYLLIINHFTIDFRLINIKKRYRAYIMSNSFIYALNSLAPVLVLSIDVMMLSHYWGKIEAGVYSTVVFIASALTVPHRALLRASSPLVAEYWQNKSMGKMKDLYERTSGISLTLGLLGFLIVWSNLPHLITFIPAKNEGDFVLAPLVFLCLMLGRIADMWGGLNGLILMSSRKNAVDILFTLTLCVAVYFFNRWLIPPYGMIGAALATSLSFLLYNILRIAAVGKLYRLNPFHWKQVAVFAVAAICTAFIGLIQVVWPVENSFWSSLILSNLVWMLGFVFVVLVFKLNRDILDSSKSIYHRLIGSKKGSS